MSAPSKLALLCGAALLAGRVTSKVVARARQSGRWTRFMAVPAVGDSCVCVERWPDRPSVPIGASCILHPSIRTRGHMPHSPHEKKRVLTRVRRIRGQADALERALEAGADCGAVLQQIAAIRGAVNGLMSEVLEAHVREEFGQAAQSDAQRDARVQELAGLVRSYLK